MSQESRNNPEAFTGSEPAPYRDPYDTLADQHDSLEFENEELKAQLKLALESINRRNREPSELDSYLKNLKKWLDDKITNLDTFTRDEGCKIMSNCYADVLNSIKDDIEED